MNFCKKHTKYHKIFCGLLLCIISSVAAQAQPVNEVTQSSTEAVIKKVSSHIKQIHEDNILLKKVINQIDTPLTGVEEIIRQEKMRMLIARLNRNIQKIEDLRKEQESQMSLIKQQKKALEQARNLP